MSDFPARTAGTSVDDLLGRIDDAGDSPWITPPDTVASFALVFPPTLEASTGAVSALIADGSLARLENRRWEAILGNLGARVEDPPHRTEASHALTNL